MSKCAHCAKPVRANQKFAFRVGVHQRASKQEKAVGHTCSAAFVWASEWTTMDTQRFTSFYNRISACILPVKQKLFSQIICELAGNVAVVSGPKIRSKPGQSAYFLVLNGFFFQLKIGFWESNSKTLAEIAEWFVQLLDLLKTLNESLCFSFGFFGNGEFPLLHLFSFQTLFCAVMYQTF